MGMETVLFKSEEKKTREEAAAVLRQLADKIEAGNLRLANDQGEVALEIPGQVEVEVKVEEETKRATKRKLEVEIEWRVGEPAGTGGLVVG